ncbi:MAG TPA: 4-alpha-glucanotransferase, partial [Xanthobacteraceae bacterium]
MLELAARAAELGIVAEYDDARGVRRFVPDETLRKLLDAFGQSQASDMAPLLWRRGRIQALDLPFTEPHDWTLTSAGQEVARGEAQRRLTVPDDVPIGTYAIAFTPRGAGAQPVLTHLLVAPEQAYQLDDVGVDRVWALAVQLYGVRSRRNWGHGDFTDLLNLVRMCPDLGAAGIGLNPLHALFDDRPEQASPYAPNSRLFLNPLYVDLEAIPEFPGIAEAGLAAEIERLRGTDQVDYTGVAAAKTKALRLAYERFCRSRKRDRKAAFKAFQADQGEALARFAAFEVLRRRFQNVWWEWPPEWRRPTDKQLKALRKQAAAEIGYYEFVQWIADEQLGRCQEEARRLRLPVGLYIDLAVGVEPGGADAWSAQESIIGKVEVGAPPDLLNTAGQAWGLAAFNPRALERAGFAPFAELLHAAMRHAGAIRLDHVLGLNRLYLIPFGAKPHEGAYVRYPLQQLLGIAAIESVRDRCLVIGEDLGTVPDELRVVLADWGIWSYLVMLFERRADGSFKHPHEYRKNALATFSTHDLPTF